MGFHGADVAELRALALRMTDGARVLETASKTLHAVIINSSAWRGPDAERFRSEWTGMSARAIVSAVESLQRAAEELRRNADEQDRAAEAAGSGGGGPGSYSATRPGAANTVDLFDGIGRDNDGVDDGMHIEEVTRDGQTRFIVYFEGTDASPERSGIRNAELIGGAPDQELIDRINEALRDHPDAEVMLVGFSMGGMDAQNIAASGQVGNVTSVVTFGSPVTQPDSDSYQSVHLRAEGDPVPTYPTFNPATVFDSSTSIFEARASEDEVCREGWDLHGSPDTYRSVAEQFDRDPGFADAKEAMAKFHGDAKVLPSTSEPLRQRTYPLLPGERVTYI